MKKHLIPLTFLIILSCTQESVCPEGAIEYNGQCYIEKGVPEKTSKAAVTPEFLKVIHINDKKALVTWHLSSRNDKTKKLAVAARYFGKPFDKVAEIPTDTTSAVINLEERKADIAIVGVDEEDVMQKPSRLVTTTDFRGSEAELNGKVESPFTVGNGNSIQKITDSLSVQNVLTVRRGTTLIVEGSLQVANGEIKGEEDSTIVIRKEGSLLLDNGAISNCTVVLEDGITVENHSSLKNVTIPSSNLSSKGSGKLKISDSLILDTVIKNFSPSIDIDNTIFHNTNGYITSDGKVSIKNSVFRDVEGIALINFGDLFYGNSISDSQGIEGEPALKLFGGIVLANSFENNVIPIQFQQPETLFALNTVSGSKKSFLSMTMSPGIFTLNNWSGEPNGEESEALSFFTPTLSEPFTKTQNLNSLLKSDPVHHITFHTDGTRSFARFGKRELSLTNYESSPFNGKTLRNLSFSDEFITLTIKATDGLGQVSGTVETPTRKFTSITGRAIAEDNVISGFFLFTDPIEDCR